MSFFPTPPKLIPAIDLHEKEVGGTLNELLFSQLIPSGFVIHRIEDDAILARVQSRDANLIRGETGRMRKRERRRRRRRKRLI